MLPTGVVGVITVGVEGIVLRSAKATIPFLALLTGQGLESGPIRPLMVRFNVRASVPHAFVTLTVTVNVPGLFGMPAMVPVLGSMDKPWGRKFTAKVSGVVTLLFKLGVNEYGVPVLPVESLV